MEREKSKKAQTTASEPREESLESTQMSLRCSSVEFQADKSTEESPSLAKRCRFAAKAQCKMKKMDFSIKLLGLGHIQSVSEQRCTFPDA